MQYLFILKLKGSDFMAKDLLKKENTELKNQPDERQNTINIFGKNILKLTLSLLSVLFAMSIAYAFSRYFEDMGGAVLFISGLLIGKYLQKDWIDF